MIKRGISCQTMKPCFYSVLLVLFWAVNASAQVGVNTVSYDGDGAVPLACNLIYYIDADSSLTPAEALQQQYIPVENCNFNLGYTDSIVWFRIAIQNTSSIDREFALKTIMRFLTDFQVYVVEEGTVRQIHQSDATTPFGERPFGTRHLAVLLNVQAGEKQELLIRFGTHGVATFQPTLMSETEVIQEQSRVLLKVAVIAAILSTLIVFNLFYFFALRARAFLFYVFMESCFLLFIATIEGFSFQYLWPNWTTINANAVRFLGPLCEFSAALFSVSFLRSKEYTPKFYKFLVGLLAVLFSYVCVTLFLPAGPSNQLGMLLSFLIIAILVPHAIYVVRAGHLAARFYLAGWLAIFIGTGFFVVFMLGWANPPFRVITVLEVTMVVEAIFMSLGLSDQYRRLNVEKQEAQNAVVTQLNARLAESKERVQIEQEKESALRDVYEKSKSLATTSHDLAQPLRALRQALTVESNNYSKPNSSFAIIDQALDAFEDQVLSSLSSASETLGTAANAVNINLAEFAANIVETHQQDALDKNLCIRYHSSDIKWMLPQNALQRCLDNLVSNAIRYTNSGGVLVSVRVRKTGLLIQVWDTGSGFSNKRKLEIFGLLERSNESPGYGLGLSIVDEICGELGWKFDARSVPEKGSVFSILIE